MPRRRELEEIVRDSKDVGSRLHDLAVRLERAVETLDREVHDCEGCAPDDAPQEAPDDGGR